MGYYKSQLKFILAILCTLIFLPNTGLGQNLNLAGINTAYYPVSEVKNTPETVKFSYKEIGAYINVPIRIKKAKTVIINGMGYGMLQVNGFDIPNQNSQPFKENLHAVYYQMMIAKKINPKFHVVMAVRPTIASDFKQKIQSDDFIFQGSGFASYKYKEQLAFGGGIAYTMRFGKPFAIPLIQFKYHKNRHAITSLFPIRTVYNYQIDKREKWKIGFKQTANGGQFNISEKNEWEQNNYNIEKVNYARINLGGSLNYKPNRFVQLELYTGTSLRRKLNLLLSSGDTKKHTLKSSAFIQIGISVAPQRKK